MEKRFVARREFLQWSALGLAGIALSACTPEEPTAAPAKEEEKEAAAEPTKAEAAEEAPVEVVKIVYQAREAEVPEGMVQLWDEFYPQFQDEHPDIEVDFQSGLASERRDNIMAAMVAGDAPDLSEWCCTNSAYFMQKGQTLDLQPFIDRDAEEVNLDDYYPKQFDPWKDEQDHIHYMPRFTGTQCVYFNKDWFDEAGVDYPPQEWGAWDYDDYVETCKQFVSREQPITWGVTNYGYGANWLSQYLIRGFGAHMVDPEDNDQCGLCDDNAMEALEWMRKGIWDDHIFAYGSEMGGLGCTQLFLGERVPMLEIGPWELGIIADGARFKWDVAPFPDGPRDQGVHQSVDGTMIWKGTEHKEACWTLLKATTTPEYGRMYAKYGQKQPSRRSVLPYFAEILREQNPIYEDVKLEVFTDSIDLGLGYPEEMFSNDDVCKSEILTPAFDQVMLLGKQPAELICQYCEVATQFNRGEIDLADLGSEMEKLGQ